MTDATARIRKRARQLGLNAALLAIAACGGDDGGDGSSAIDLEGLDAGAEATAACVEGCDHQVELGCPQTPAGYGTVCVALCERTTQITSDQCLGPLLLQQRCSANLRYSCDASGTPRPAGNCASEAAACAQCSGTLCSAAFAP